MSLSSRLTALKKIPEDILVEILVRLPVRSLMRFKCVSRSWFFLISSKYFTTLFFKFSSLGERRVFMCVEDMKDCMLFSSSRNNLEATTDSFPELNRLTLPGMAYLSDFVNALRGLMCFRVGRAPRVPKEIWIRNLATRQVLRLPLVKSNIFKSDDQYCMWNYFGYDHVNNEYKVLNTINHPLWTHKSETRILVLGAGASWRNTKSLTSPPPHHRPRGQGIFINGVLYYGAWSHERRFVLMSFDFNSEEFTLIEFPIEANIKWDGYPHIVNLMNYQYQVALFDGSRLKTECILDLWVLEDARNSKWSPKFFDLPCDQLRKSVDMDYLLIRGTSRSGEIMLYDRCFSRNKKITLVIYDLDRNCITRGFVIKTTPICLGFFALWDDVESIMYLEA